uniref:GNAT family N-acetyltransferase n=1 Tax=Paenibacillus polymyxa TaxID=1406 RepID=A0AAE9IHE3_PAEPO
MFKNIKTDSDREEVLELLTYAVLDHPERGEAALRTYQASDDWKLFGVEDEGLIVGIVGFEEQEDGTTVIRHLAVLPENRHRGYARGMLLTLIQERNPKRLTVDTDAEGQISSATWALPSMDQRICQRVGNSIVYMK